MDCPRCGAKAEKDWAFCPRCGSRLSGDSFEGIFSRMRKELQEMNKLFDLDKDIEAFDLSPWFRDLGKMEKKRIILQPKGSGFTIRIVQSGDRRPRVSFRTFGEVDKEKLKKEIEEIGAWQPEFKAEKPGRQPEAKTPMKEPARTEEPKTSIKRLDSKLLVGMELPGVTSEESIEISELESSVEVKAFAGDKAYFKILTKPPQLKLTKKSFGKGRLSMEFSRA